MTETTIEVQKSPEIEALEKQKLELEIAKLKQPPWMNPSYLALTTPLIVAGFSIYISSQTGFFDFQKAKLDWEQKRLQVKIDAQQEQRTQLENDIATFEQQKKDLEQQIAQL